MPVVYLALTAVLFSVLLGRDPESNSKEQTRTIC